MSAAPQIIIIEPRRLHLVSPPPPPDRPPSDDVFKSAVYSFVTEEPRRRNVEQERHLTLVNKITELDSKVADGFHQIDQRIKGVEARVNILEQGPVRTLSPASGIKAASGRQTDTGSHMIFELEKALDQKLERREEHDDAVALRAMKGRASNVVWLAIGGAVLVVLGALGLVIVQSIAARGAGNTTIVAPSH